MQFTQEKNLYKAVRITGPSHNLLSIALSNADIDEVILEALPVPQKSASKPDFLVGEEVKKCVLEGVSEANGACGTNYKVSKIQYIPSDTPPATIYKTLAQKIIERIAANQFRFDREGQF